VQADHFACEAISLPKLAEMATKCMPQMIEPIHIDPSVLPGFADDFEQDVSNYEKSEGFDHDPDWVNKNRCVL